MRTPDTYKSSTLEQLQVLVERIVEQSPELASRARSAAGILSNGKLSTADGVIFEAVASDDATVYAVDLGSDERGCTCRDYEYRGIPDPRGRKSCKHTIAGVLFNKLGRSRPSARVARLATFRPADRRRPARLIGKVAA
jgi:hypothetical protein